MEFERERAFDLLRAYDICLQNATHVYMPRIYAQAAAMPASRFWVSYIRATLVVSSIIRGDRLLNMRTNKRNMYFEIYRRVCSLRNRHPNLSISEAVRRVIREPAPSFYITASSSKLIILKYRKQWQRLKMQRLLH